MSLPRSFSEGISSEFNPLGLDFDAIEYDKF